jgi:hypothetical protein
VRGVGLAEDMKADHAVDIEQEAQQQDDVPHGRDRSDHRADDQPQLRKRGNEPRDSQEARQARNHRERAGLWEQGHSHDAEVEHVPAVRKEGRGARPVREDPKGDLHDEDHLDQDLEGGEGGAVAGSERRRCFDADDDRPNEDDTEDEMLKARVVRDPTSSCDHAHGPPP